MRLNLVIVSILLLIFCGVVVAQDKTEAKAEAKTEKASHEYVGDKKCKTCHKEVHASWLETTHAKAYDVLSDEEKKKEECIVCHTTGTTAKGVLLEGIQCESCHGAGKDYKSPKIMSKKKWKADPEVHKKMALDAGLIEPNETVCVKCHTKEGNTNFKPLDFAKKIGEVHVFPSATPAEEKKGE